jgi:3-oxoacyl-[acyl-carrier protein] reductase
VSVIGDVTTPAGAADTVRRAHDALGSLDVLINCLGDSVGGPMATVTPGESAMSDETATLVLDVNLAAAIYCARAIGPELLERRTGSIINISSVAALRGGAGTVVYTAAKTGVVGFTRALALEWAPYGIRVNGIAPGLFPDPQSQSDEYRARLNALAATFPLGRAGETREVGYLARYLIAPASAYLTGQTIFLDGGWSLGSWSLPDSPAGPAPSQSS